MGDLFRKMSRKLPPFAALRAFEAVARHGSIKEASGELSISVSAISHQLKSIEEFVGAKLILRDGDGLRVTEEGKVLFEVLCRCLDEIEAATRAIASNRLHEPITINCFVSFAELWLAPKLDHFCRQHPNIGIRIVTVPEQIVLSGSPVDIAIKYAPAHTPPREGIFLMEEDVYPVCAPGYLGQGVSLPCAADVILGRNLIYSSLHPTEWSDWARAAGTEMVSAPRSLEFDNRALAIAAAARGAGIAMARRPYADLAIQIGTLVAPCTTRLRTGFSYYLVIAERSCSLPQVKLFRQWIVGQAR